MKKDRSKYTHVTEVIKHIPYSAEYSMIPKSILQDAINRSKIVHNAAKKMAKRLPKAYLEGIKYRDQTAYNYIKLIQDYKKNNVKKILYAEKQFHNDKLELIGSPDWIVELKNGEIAIIDFKWVSKLSKDYVYQLAAYNFLYNNKIHNYLIFWLKDNDLKIIKISNTQIKRAIMIFISTLTNMRLTQHITIGG